MVARVADGVKQDDCTVPAALPDEPSCTDDGSSDLEHKG